MSQHKLRAAIYFVASTLSSLITFLLLPVFTHALSAAELGQYSLFQLVVSASLPLVSLTLSTVIGRQFIELQGAAFSRYFSSCFWLSWGSFIAICALAWLLQSVLLEWLKLEPFWIWMACICAAAQGLLSIMVTMNTIQKKAMQYAAWRIVSATLIGFSALVAVYVFHWGWQGIAGAQAAISAVIIIALALAMYRHGWLRGQVDKADSKHALHYSTPLVVHALAGMVATQVTDRLFVSYYLGIGEVGVYHVAQQLAMAMWLFVNAINLAWTPWYYERMKEGTPAAQRKIVVATYQLFAFMLLAAGLCIAILWVLFPYLIGDGFEKARYLFPFLVIGFVFNGMYMITSTALFYSGHTKWIAITTVSTALIGLALNALLVPSVGMWGAAISTMLSMVAMYVIVWGIVMRRFTLPWRLARADA
ncbi:MAG: oligosaccharide flippase family protein [Rickettsiales bacterium]|nr:oligosaccharide flippase family protein [Rickettsiales bacterium]